MGRRLKSRLDEAARANAILLHDGSFSEGLLNRQLTLKAPGWTAHANFENVDAVTAVYEDFLNAGVDLLTTNTYQHAAALLDPIYGADEVERRFKQAIRNADQCRTASGRNDVLILCSIGSYAVIAGNGAEYTADYAREGIDPEILLSYYRQQLVLLGEENGDGILFETIPSKPDIEAILEVTKDKREREIIISIVPDGLKIRDGTTIGEIVKLLMNADNVVALGLNCSTPADVLSQIEEIVALGWREKGKHIIVYPNSGEEFEAGRYIGEKTDIADLVKSWHEAGATAIGGCCRVGIEQLRKIGEAVKKINHQNRSTDSK